MQFLRSIGRAGLVLLIFQCSFQTISAQCNTAANARWQPYLDWISPTAPAVNYLSLSVFRFAAQDFGLNVNSLVFGYEVMNGKGGVNFRREHLDGISCLQPRSIKISNPQNCQLADLQISFQFFASGGGAANPGKVFLGGVEYRRTASNGDIHLFQKVGGGEWIIVRFRKFNIG